MSVQQAITQLLRSANQVDKLTLLDRTRLFQWASVTLHDQGGELHLVHRLSEYGRLSDNRSDEEISRWLLEAVEILKESRK